MATQTADLAALASDFESPTWNSGKALSVLFTYKHERSTVQSICTAMERLTDADLLSTLMQFCHMIVIYDLPELEELLMFRCQGSMHFALRMFFLLQAAMEDEIPELVFKTNRLWKQCELAAINAESNSPPRNRVCVENGFFQRRSNKDGASLSPPPRLLRSNSFSSSLPSILPYHATSSETKLDSLFASTSLLPYTPVKSPSSSKIETTMSPYPIELNPETSVWSTTADTITNDSHSHPRVTLPQVPMHLMDLSIENSNEILKNTQEITVNSVPIQSNSSSTNNGKTDKDLVTFSPPQPQPNYSSTSEATSSQSLPLSGNTTPIKSPERPSFTDTPTSPTASTAVLNPSYASAVPHSPESVSQPPGETDKSFGSTFYFKLRQLSGEGKSGKQRVYEYFYTELHMINSLFNISTALMSISLDSIQKLKEVRGRALHLLLTQINTQLIQSEYQSPSSASASISSNDSVALIDESLTYGIEIPIIPGWVIVKIHPEDSFCLSSRNRIPYMMLIEVLAFDNVEGDAVHNQPQHQVRSRGTEVNEDSDAEEDWVLLNDDAPKESTVKKKGFIELWTEKEGRIRDSSPFSHLPGWRLAGVIVKSGDDLRQEQLASQLIFKMHSWFQAEKLPLYLRPYVVLAASSTAGLIECIPDTCSIDGLKKRISNFGTLSNYYICSYGHRTSHKFLVAQTNFVESLAAYSIVCYLLQIKDRHNGNILLDVEGHVIHIDFGFMLSISPGNINFEQAPFKLNQEMVDLMGGPHSDMFKYFKTLLLSGLLEVRRHSTELLLLVEVMAGHSKMACFQRGGAQVLSGLRERLALERNEEEMLALVDTLVYNSMRSWTTQSYDSYQYYTNGIL